MERHDLDLVSFLFGIVFTGLASWVLFAGDLDLFDVRWLGPALLILGGVALIASMFTRRDRAVPGAPTGDAAASAGLEAAREELPPDPFGRD